jgi:xanthine dehydrogenase accessory factor
VCLVTRIDGDDVAGTALYDQDSVGEAGDDVRRLWDRGASDTVVEGDTVTTLLWPVPQLVVVGAGPVVDAVAVIGRLLGWQTQVTADPATARGLIAPLAPLDKLVIATHDDDLAGPALAAALTSAAGYIGAMGSRRTQAVRAQWLADRGLTDLGRVHGPAGLDIGASSPGEIAVSIMAEAVSASRLDLPAPEGAGT